MNFFSKPKRIDYEKQELVLELQFLEPDLLLSMEEMIRESQLCKTSLSSYNKSKVTDNQRAFYYVFLTEVLKKNDVLPTSDAVAILDEEIRQDLFPCYDVDFGGKTVPRIKRMRNMTDREMARMLYNLTERYSYLNIDMSLLRSQP
jgi:hypothetical protein